MVEIAREAVEYCKAQGANLARTCRNMFMVSECISAGSQLAKN